MRQKFVHTFHSLCATVSVACGYSKPQDQFRTIIPNIINKMTMVQKSSIRPAIVRKLLVSALLVGIVIQGYFGITSDAGYDPHRLAMLRTQEVRPVDCNDVAPIEPVHISYMHSVVEDAQYKVSFSSWDGRLRDPLFGTENNTTAPSNPVIRDIQSLLPHTNGAFVDVGANVGFMTHFAIALGRTTYAFDPIAYNVAKLCEGYRENSVERQSGGGSLLLYRAVAGPEDRDSVDVWRPAKKHFDQSSLTSEAVLSTKEVINESVSMIRVDSVVPEDVDVGMAKIDVQGHELDVLRGMENILGRTKGYPRYVYYEESSKHIAMAGHQPGQCEELLGRYGYSCSKRIGGNILCEKQQEQSVQIV